MTIEDALLRGSQFARDHLEILEKAYGKDAAMAYAAGLAAGLRNYVAAARGARGAYDLFSGLADDIIAQQFKQRNDNASG
ncbi:MAG: hypothetical protein ACREB8_01070 [Pseudolabrys sp.]